MSELRGKYYVFNETRMCFLSLGVVTANTRLTRLMGPVGILRLSHDDGLWIVPFKGVHTFGIFSPVDVIYLDAEHRVLYSVEHLGPFRIAPTRLESDSMLQLPPHTIFGTGTQVGDQLLICSPEEMRDYWKTVRDAEAPEPAGMSNGGMEQHAADYARQEVS